MNKLILHTFKSPSTLRFTSQRLLCTSKTTSNDKNKAKSKEKAPEDFFDERGESEKEFFDIVETIKHNSLDFMSSVKVSYLCFIIAIDHIIHLSLANTNVYAYYIIYFIE